MGPLLQSLVRPAPWFTLFAVWIATLYWLGSRPPDPEPLFEIPHFDKVAHFIYFAAGATFLSLALRLHPNINLAPLTFLLTVTLTLALLGALDELHQTQTPGRQGADPYDWLADILGALAGTLIVLKASQYFPPPSPRRN
ncbi:MAG: VanZ family protein [Verrucomicrobiota bacterium]